MQKLQPRENKWQDSSNIFRSTQGKDMFQSFHLSQRQHILNQRQQQGNSFVEQHFNLHFQLKNENKEDTYIDTNELE